MEETAKDGGTAYVHRLVVGSSDIDRQGHANNVVWVGWMQEAGIAHARVCGYGSAWHEEHGVGWVAREHQIRYRRPAYEGERLEVVTFIEEMGRASCLRRYRFLRGEELLAEASTQWALVDAETGRPKRIPEDMKTAFSAPR